MCHLVAREYNTPHFDAAILRKNAHCGRRISNGILEQESWFPKKDVVERMRSQLLPFRGDNRIDQVRREMQSTARIQLFVAFSPTEARVFVLRVIRCPCAPLVPVATCKRADGCPCDADRALGKHV